MGFQEKTVRGQLKAKHFLKFLSACSRLYAEALGACLAEHGPSVVTERLDAVYADDPPALDEGLVRAQLESSDDEAW